MKSVNFPASNLLVVIKRFIDHTNKYIGNITIFINQKKTIDGAGAHFLYTSCISFINQFIRTIKRDNTSVSFALFFKNSILCSFFELLLKLMIASYMRNEGERIYYVVDKI